LFHKAKHQHSETTEDIDIVVFGPKAKSVDLRAYCRLKFFKDARFRFHLTCEKSLIGVECVFSNYNTCFNKYINSWSIANSNTPLHKPISYFEIKLAHCPVRGWGVLIGVGENKFSVYDYESYVGLHTNETGNISSLECVVVNRPPSVRTGDIIGVVVDYVQDRILFYKNGKHIANGIKKPSDFDELYAFVCTYHQHSALQICERYPYENLQS
jgi:hypothetical protein